MYNRTPLEKRHYLQGYIVGLRDFGVEDHPDLDVNEEIASAMDYFDGYDAAQHKCRDALAEFVLSGKDNFFAVWWSQELTAALSLFDESC